MYVTIRTTHEVNALCLAALLWDAVMHDADDEAEAYQVVTSLTGAEVKALVRRQLTQHGTASVECGPQHGYPSDHVESAVRCRISNVYGAH